MVLLDPNGDAVRTVNEVRTQYPQQESHRPDISGNQYRLSEAETNGQNTLQVAYGLKEKNKHAEAWEIVERYLAYEDPNSCSALTIALDIWRKQNKPAIAYQFAKRVADMAPEEPTAWTNLGMIADSLYQFDEAERCFKTAVSLARSDHDKGTAFINWGCMLINKGNWAAAEVMARRAIKYRPDSIKSRANLGLACLALKNFREGWPLYDAIIGFDQSRRKVQYKDEPIWDGKPVKTLVGDGEQGLGDEISFASMIPDAARDCSTVVLDCTDRLAPLFQRSFPSVKVYGTRWEKGLGWAKNDALINASISIGALGKFYRNEEADFPGTPYLVADPDRVAMWKGLFQKQSKPVIGIAWTGGVPWTADRFRRWSLDDLLPVFRSIDAVWVSLEYKDATKQIVAFRSQHPEIDLRQYAFGTLTDDYDDTAAMVEAMDLVFAMQTSVIHLAGGLGKECWGFVNRYSTWRYGVDDDRLLWAKSVKLYRQNKAGVWPLQQAADDLSAWSK